MHAMTQQHMINAFGGESQAHMRYLLFADIADKEGKPQVGRLLRAVAAAEYIHAGDHYRELRHLKDGFVANSMAAFGPGDTAKNLDLSIAGETFEIQEMYPAYIEVAKLQNETSAQRSFEWSYGTEIQHKALFEKAKRFVDRGQDAQIGPLRVCETCGYTLEGDIPDRCPICNVSREKFRTY